MQSALGCIMTTLTPEFVNNCVGTRLRAEEADLPEYLLSRSCAGATEQDLIAGIHRGKTLFRNKQRFSNLHVNGIMSCV